MNAHARNRAVRKNQSSMLLAGLPRKSQARITFGLGAEDTRWTQNKSTQPVFSRHSGHRHGLRPPKRHRTRSFSAPQCASSARESRLPIPARIVPMETLGTVLWVRCRHYGNVALGIGLYSPA